MFYVRRALVQDVHKYMDDGWRIVGKTWIASMKTYDVLLRKDCDIL